MTGLLGLVDQRTDLGLQAGQLGRGGITHAGSLLAGAPPAPEHRYSFASDDRLNRYAHALHQCPLQAVGGLHVGLPVGQDIRVHERLT
jgi:hypothetical protein